MWNIFTNAPVMAVRHKNVKMCRCSFLKVITQGVFKHQVQSLNTGKGYLVSHIWDCTLNPMLQ